MKLVTSENEREFLIFAADSRSACHSKDPELFYPHPSDAAQIAEAKAVCNRCPIIAECLDHALAIDDRWAILGGTAPHDRQKIKRRRRRKAAALAALEAAA